MSMDPLQRDDAPPVTIRPITLDDAEEVAQLLAAIVGSDVPTGLRAAECTPDAQRAFIEALPDERATYLAAVDESNGAIVGVQDVLPNEHEPRVGDVSTFVHVERAREGIGAALMRATVERAEALGYDELHAVIRRANSPATCFYATQGFESWPHADGEAIVGVRVIGSEARAKDGAPPIFVVGRFERSRTRRVPRPSGCATRSCSQVCSFL